MSQPGENISRSWSLPEVSLAPLGKGMRLIPGIALLLAIGYSGKITAAHVPHMEYVLLPLPLAP